MTQLAQSSSNLALILDESRHLKWNDLVGERLRAHMEEWPVISLIFRMIAAPTKYVNHPER